MPKQIPAPLSMNDEPGIDPENCSWKGGGSGVGGGERELIF